MNENFFGSKILKYKDDILKDLAELVKIPSVVDQSNPTQEAPFGAEAKKALDWTINKAEEFGFKTKCVKNKTAHAEIGEGSNYVATAAHVDVVPVSDGWNSDPYELVIKDNTIYCRGVADDKGSAVITLYCLKVLEEEKVAGKHRLRAIFGSGEEVNSDDIETYFEEEELPVMAFTPDSEYGICNAEKGIARYKFEDSKNNNGIIKKLKGGTVVNSVINLVNAEIECGADEFEKLQEKAKDSKCEFELSFEDGIAKIKAIGIAAHAMEPEKGLNAATHLVSLLSETFGRDKIGNICTFIDSKIGLELNGQSLNVGFKDAPSGPLTVNLGLIDINEESNSFWLDIRYPVTVNGSEITKNILEVAKSENINAENMLDNKPLYFDTDKPLIKVLNNAYKNVIGEDATVYSTGGGTYAREFSNTCVAFGGNFQSNGMHQANEGVNVDEFFLSAQICLEAMYQMYISDEYTD